MLCQYGNANDGAGNAYENRHPVQDSCSYRHGVSERDAPRNEPEYSRQRQQQACRNKHQEWEIFFVPPPEMVLHQ